MTHVLVLLAALSFAAPAPTPTPDPKLKPILIAEVDKLVAQKKITRGAADAAIKRDWYALYLQLHGHDRIRAKHPTPEKTAHP